MCPYLDETQIPAFIAGVVLLLSIWGARHTGASIDSTREMKDVHKCMTLLRDDDSRLVTLYAQPFDLSDRAIAQMGNNRSSLVSNITSRHDSFSEFCRGILHDLAVVGSLPLPRGSQKRPREDPGPRPRPSSFQFPAKELRSSGRPPPSTATSSSENTPPAQDQHVFETFPMHSDELGRMPIYPYSTPMDSWLADSSGVPQATQVDSGDPFNFQGSLFDPDALGPFASGQGAARPLNGLSSGNPMDAPEFMQGLMNPAQPLASTNNGVSTLDMWSNLPRSTVSYDCFRFLATSY